LVLGCTHAISLPDTSMSPGRSFRLQAHGKEALGGIALRRRAAGKSATLTYASGTQTPVAVPPCHKHASPAPCPAGVA